MSDHSEAYNKRHDISNRVVVTPSGSPGGTMDYSYAPSGMRVWRVNPQLVLSHQ